MYRRAPIDCSTFPDSDGEPVAENRDNLVQMSNLISTSRCSLELPLRAYRRVGDRLVAQPLLPGSGPAVHSPALGTELRVVGRWLRLIDPASGEPIPVPEEDHEGRQAAEARAEREERARREEDAQLAAEEQARREAAARVVAEAQREAAARYDAESALAAALAELARLCGEGSPPSGDTPDL